MKWAPKISIKSKSHVPKIMMLAAVGAPTAEAVRCDAKNGKGTGKVGIWRVTKMRRREKGGWGRGEKNTVAKQWYKKGDMQRVAARMDAEKFCEMMEDDVYPALVQHYGGVVGRVVVQMDNARPHIGKNTVGKLNTHFAQLKTDVVHGVRSKVDADSIPDIKVTTQSPQSPDTNICDLAFFSASSVGVRKRRRVQGRGFDVDKLEDDVEKVFKQYPTENLCRMWNTKAAVLQKIVRADGRNDYDLHGKVATAHARGERKWNFPSYDVGK